MPAEQEQTLPIQQALELAIQHHTAGDLPKAEGIYNQIIQAEPNQPVALHLLGVIAHQVGKNDISVELITKALTINPHFAEAQNNLGNTLQELEKLDEAAACYKKAIAIKPDFAEAHSNLGNALNELGNLDEAVASYNKALAIKPGYAVAHFNLHSLMLDPNDMMSSINHMEKAVNTDPYNNLYRFILGMLLDYSGDSQKSAAHFSIVERGGSGDIANLDAWNYIKLYNNPLPPITGPSIEAFKIGMKAAVNEGLVLEFGVRFGTSIRLISELVEQEVHGFDSFEGLPEAWQENPKGSYSTKGVIPSVPDNVILHNGWFEKTLPSFIDQHQVPIRFMNIGCDIYSSTKTIFDLLEKQITHGTVIVFDEYIGNASWREDEFKAFQEAVLSNGWKYEYLCFSFFTKQVVVRIS